VGGSTAIIDVYLSYEASETTKKYETWQEAFDRAIDNIAIDPYPDGWVASTAPDDDDPEGYSACVVVDYPPFQYTYRFDTPIEITILTIRLCWPYSHMM
jgi:hypothetical protein